MGEGREGVVRINDLLNRRRGMMPSTDLRLAKFYGNIPASFPELAADPPSHPR